MMGFLKYFRSKSKLKNSSPQPAPSYDSSYPIPSRPRYGHDLTQRLPDRVLENIFTFVCPHTLDQSYEASEKSQIGDGCMLCDLRDLSKCAQVCRNWYGIAQRLLYTSIRIDAVHYCALEEELAERRKKSAGRHFRGKNPNVEPVDVPNVRLQLLCRTVREQPNIASEVLVLKVPYMTRETAKAELARTVSALQNLRYIDLPDGFYAGDPSCLALREELQARCPDIRKMSYRSGSEEALELLAQRHWQNIEILELSSLAIEPATLRIVLGSLPKLQNLALLDLSWMEDSIFSCSQGNLPNFPAVQALKLIDIPNVTAQGFRWFLESTQNRETLHALTLQNTGVTISELSSVLWAASSLQHLSITATVSKSLTMSTQEPPPLASISLKTLDFEITSSEDVHGLQKPAESYYAYLASSLHHNALPALATLYVRDQNFPDLLLVSSMMAPPMPQPFGSGANGTGRSASPHHSPGDSLKSKPSNVSTQSLQLPSNNKVAPFGQKLSNGGGQGFTQTLEVFSKGIDELEWVFTAISPPSPIRNQSQSTTSGGRPLSAYSASRGLGPQWAQGGFGGEARKSVIVGNGFGGFLAIPQEEAPRPMTSDGDRTRASRLGSIGTQGSQDSKGSLLKPPPSVSSLAGAADKRKSRHDLWR